MRQMRSCKTPGAIFSTTIDGSGAGTHVNIGIQLPHQIDLDQRLARLLEDDLHDALELVLASWLNPGRTLAA